MPKRKNAPKAPPASVEDRRDRNLRVVHREEMTATVGEILEHEHTDAAIELLYVQDNLAAGRDLNDLSALNGTPAADDVVDAAKVEDDDVEKADAARVEGDFETAPPTTDHAKTGSPMENLAAAVVVEAGAIAAEAAAAVGVVKAAASTIADAVNDSVAASSAPVVDSATAARERARDENAAEARADRDVEEPATPMATKPASLLRFLSPRFVLKATRDAVGELVGGVRQARNELRGAGERARACFGAVRP